MPRIRTVKPTLFQHGALFDAEAATGLPLRLAYIGLWTQCDRRGCFHWRPRELKLNVLPFDSCDFGAVLDALAQHGFLRKYGDSNEFGHVITWERHQIPNIKERADTSIPDPPETCQHCASTVPAPCQHSASTVGKGREGKGMDQGKGMERKGTGGTTDPEFSSLSPGPGPRRSRGKQTQPQSGEDANLARLFADRQRQIGTARPID